VSSQRELIIQAAVAALNVGTPSGVPPAERATTLALDSQTLPKILVYLGPKDRASDVGGPAGPIRDCSLSLTIDCWAAGTEVLSADAAADPLVVWVIKALEDQHLGGLVTGLREAETEFELARADVPICVASVKMIAEYTHKAGDLEIQA
jgi:hypothetical protein